uniref:ULP_PROTEASE domain-containing protein n=1 Tax=Parastrongyloides trichosuri TaxID=131310 RepID=A0A0N4ZHV4_PARTI
MEMQQKVRKKSVKVRIREKARKASLARVKKYSQISIEKRNVEELLSKAPLPPTTFNNSRSSTITLSSKSSSPIEPSTIERQINDIHSEIEANKSIISYPILPKNSDTISVISKKFANYSSLLKAREQIFSSSRDIVMSPNKIHSKEHATVASLELGPTLNNARTEENVSSSLGKRKHQEKKLHSSYPLLTVPSEERKRVEDPVIPGESSDSYVEKKKARLYEHNEEFERETLSPPTINTKSQKATKTKLRRTDVEEQLEKKLNELKLELNKKDKECQVYKNGFEHLKRELNDMKEKNAIFKIELAKALDKLLKLEEGKDVLTEQKNESQNSNITRIERGEVEEFKINNGIHFSDTLTRLIFSHFEQWSDYENIPNLVIEELKNTGFNTSDFELGRSKINKFAEQFKVCALHCSGYLLKRFIDNKGKGVIFYDKTTMKDQELETFILCGKIEDEYYQINIGTVESTSDKEKRNYVGFNKLINAIAKTIDEDEKQFRDKVYNCLDGLMNDCIAPDRYCRNIIERARIVANNDNREKLTNYSCLANIARSLSKNFSDYIGDLDFGSESVEFTKEISKKLCKMNLIHYPSSEYYLAKLEGSSKKDLEIASYDGCRIEALGTICNNVFKAREVLLEFAEETKDKYEISKEILLMLNKKEYINNIAFVSYVHELMIYPIQRAGNFSNIAPFVKFSEKFMRELKEKYVPFSEIKLFLPAEYINIFNFEKLEKVEEQYEKYGTREQRKIIIKMTEYINKQFIKKFKNISKEEKKAGIVIKSPVNIIYEDLLATIKMKADFSKHESISLRNAQISASMNNMTEVLKNMPKKDFRNADFKSVVMDRELSRIFRDWDKENTKTNIEGYNFLFSKEEREEAEKKSKELCDNLINRNKIIKTIGEVENIIDKLATKKHIMTFVGHQIKLRKESIKNKGLEVPRKLRSRDYFDFKRNLIEDLEQLIDFEEVHENANKPVNL